MEATSEATRGTAYGREKWWLAAVIIAAGVLYAPTFVFFWGKWVEDAQYSLAPLVPFVSGYFVWKKWPDVKRLMRSPSVWGLVLICIAVAMHLTGVILDVTGPSGWSVFVMLVGCCLYFHGAGLLKTLWFPIAYTIFIIPIPGGILDLIGFPLQLWASGATARLLALFGMEVSRSGVNLSVPGFDFQVAQACSGMSSLVALIGVTAVFAYISRLPAGYKWFLFFLAIPVAFAANVVRITTIALVGYWWGRHAAIDLFHDWSSPILFLAAIILLVIINGVLEWVSGRRKATS